MDNKATVKIYGTSYHISTAEEILYTTQLGEEIDLLVTEIMRSGKTSVNDALLLAAFNYLDLYKKADRSTDNLRRQITEYAEEASKVRAELNEAKKEILRLEKENGKA